MNIETGPSRYLTIEGNIGAGKTTFCAEVRKRLGSKKEPEHSFIYSLDDILNEPVTQYESYNFEGTQHNPLNSLYTNTKTDVGFCQLHFLVASADYFNADHDSWQEHFLTDRCYISTVLFILLYYKLGYFSQFVFHYLLDIFLKLLHKAFIPDCFIYLDVPSKLCYERMKQRNRDSESSMNIFTIEVLNDILKEWFTHLKKYNYNVIHLTVNENETPGEIVDKMDNYYFPYYYNKKTCEEKREVMIKVIRSFIMKQILTVKEFEL